DATGRTTTIKITVPAGSDLDLSGTTAANTDSTKCVTSTTTSTTTTSTTTTTVPVGLIPGGGPARSDCYVELQVVGIDNPGPDLRSGRVVSCPDGDPCDTDGECGNGSCTFGVAVCINQTDPNLPACHPPTGLQNLFVNPANLAGAVPGSLDGSACGSFVAIPLP